MTPVQRTANESLEEILAPPDSGQVEEVLRALAAALRSYRLYEGSNPMVDRFVGAVRQKMEALWETIPELRLQIEEHSIRWEDQLVFPTGESGGDLPFAFYKDGIREITLLPGFEESELLSVLNVLARVPAVREEEDDLITLLWQEELTKLRYRAVEMTTEGVELHAGSATALEAVDPEAVRRDESVPERATTEGFEESLYFLDDAELRLLRAEVRRESERDLWRDVLNAMLDRLEDADAERQLRIVAILGELLPATLATADFDRAASLLEGLSALASRPGLLGRAALDEVDELFGTLGTEQTINQLASLLEESPERLGDGSIPRLLAFFPPKGIGPLMRASERTDKPAVRRALDGCIQRLAERGREEVVELLRVDDPAIVAGALVWIGKLKIGAAVSSVVKALQHTEATVRIASLDALVALGAAAAGNSIVPLLDDLSREVRIGAVRALGELTFNPARTALETVLASKRLHDADRTEKLAFFESYGRLAGAEGVAVLDRILNAKSWIGRGETPEYRACAALGLARIRHPSARESLNAAASDRDPVVRAAVSRALRGEAE